MVACGRGSRAGCSVYDSARRPRDIAHECEVSAYAAEGRERPAAGAGFAVNRAVGEVGYQQPPVRRKSETGVFLARGQSESRNLSCATVDPTNHLAADVGDIDCSIGGHGDI